MKKNLNKASTVSGLRVNEGKKILLGGSQLVFVSMRPGVQPPPGFVEQPPRSASGDFVLRLKRNAPKVHVYLAPSVFEFSKKRFALSVDACLAWGMRQRKGVVALICGVPEGSSEDERFEVDVLVFDAGTLVSLTANELPGLLNPRFKLSAEAVVNKIRSEHPAARVCLAAPLQNWHVDGVEYVGEKVLARATYVPLARTFKASGNLVVPIAIAATGALASVGVVVAKWNAFEAAQSRFIQAYASPEVRAAGGVDSAYIGVMTQRRTFMEEPRRQDVLPAKVLDIVRGVGAVPGVKIRELQLPAPGLLTGATVAVVVPAEAKATNDLISDNRVADARIEISVPKSDEPALVQARVVLKQIWQSTGMSVRLAPNGSREDGGKRRIYTVEGFLHG